MTMQAFEKMNCLKRGIVVHSRKPAEQLLEDLKRHGFDPESVPKVPFGGFWTLGCFRRWMEERVVKERKKYERRSGAAAAVPFSSPSFAAEEAAGGQPQAVIADGAEASASADDEEEDYGELLRKKRKMGAAYARRKRARNKIEMEVMQTEVERLKSQKSSLVQEGVRLQGLLSEARSMADRIESDPVLLAEASVVLQPPKPSTARTLSPQGPPSANPTQAPEVEPRGGLLIPPVDQQQGDQLHFLLQLMNSVSSQQAPPVSDLRLANSFSMSGMANPYQPLQPPSAHAQNLLLSLLAGAGLGGGPLAVNNDATTYGTASSAASTSFFHPQQQQTYQNQENFLRSLCALANDDPSDYSNGPHPSTRT
jgi:hypothetical protein